VPKHLGNIQLHSGNLSGNIQGTFREQSGNMISIQGTIRKHSGNIQGAFRKHDEHSGNIQGIHREFGGIFEGPYLPLMKFALVGVV
jgi:hypothetical protein